MPDNPTHNGSISSDFFGVADEYTAECSCGWRGSKDVPEKQANRELERHYFEVKHAG